MYLLLIYTTLLVHTQAPDNAKVAQPVHIINNLSENKCLELLDQFVQQKIPQLNGMCINLSGKTNDKT